MIHFIYHGNEIGQVYKDYQHTLLYPLHQNHRYEQPLRPQRNVTQLNSTYLELTDMCDFDRGEMSVLMGFLVMPVSVFLTCFGFITAILLLFKDVNVLLIPLFLVIGLMAAGLVVFCIIQMKQELFTYTHFPIRFNRKNGKVYVIGSNRTVEIYDWHKLKIHLEERGEGCTRWGIRCCDVDDKGIIQRSFALPFRYLIADGPLYGHFEFVRRYMSAQTDEELQEVVDSVRYIFPIHKRKETFKESFERSLFEFHDKSKDIEYPKESIEIDYIFVLSIPFWLGKLLGRRLSVMSCRTPHFSEYIENECQIDLDDRFDLNKKPPIPELLKPPSFLEKIANTIFMIIATLFSLSAITLILDIFGFARPHADYPSFFLLLWDWLLFKWI